MAEMTDRELLDALGVDAKPQKKTMYSKREERIIAGFEDIQRFVQQQGHPPNHGEGKDIFERIYAVRLEQIRHQPECRELLKELDNQGLLDGADAQPEGDIDELDDDELLSQLGIDGPAEGDITQLKHVKSRADVRAAEEIANRTSCDDFELFKALFDTVQQQLISGLRDTLPFQDVADISQDDWFILSGQKVYVAEAGEAFVTDYDRKDRRLRVIYDNGTESDLLMRSLQRALHKDSAGRRIVEAAAGPLFSGQTDDDDLASGTIYVLRSQSDQPLVAENRELVHKIGVTGGSVEKRITNASNDPTFLLADVEVVASYELFNINRTKLEKLIHRFFEPARLDIQINDRFGKPVVPREWFLVPLFVIDEMVRKIKDGTIGDYYYDPKAASLKLLIG